MRLRAPAVKDMGAIVGEHVLRMGVEHGHAVIVFDTAGGVQSALCARTIGLPRSIQRSDGLGDGQRALCVGDMEVLDHSPVDGHDAAPIRDSLVERRDHPAGMAHLVVRGRPGLVGDVDLARMDQRLAVESELDSLRTFGLEAVAIRDVVVDPVENRLAGFACSQEPRWPSGEEGRVVRQPAGREASRARSLVPITITDTRGCAAISLASRIAVGVSIIAHTVIVLGAPAESSCAATSSTYPAEATFGTTTAEAVDLAIAARSAAPHCVSRPLQRIVNSRVPYAPEAAAAQAALRADSLASGATASSRSKMMQSAGSVFAFSSARSLAAGMYSADRRGRKLVMMRTRRPRRVVDRAGPTDGQVRRRPCIA